MHVVMSVSASGCSGLCKRRVAFDVEGAFAQLRLRLRKVAFSAIKRCLKGSWIYFEQHLALADERTLCVVLLDDVACDLGANLCVDVTVQGCHPFAIHGDIARFHRRYLDFRYWHRCRCLTLVAA